MFPPFSGWTSLAQVQRRCPACLSPASNRPSYRADNPTEAKLREKTIAGASLSTSSSDCNSLPSGRVLHPRVGRGRSACQQIVGKASAASSTAARPPPNLWSELGIATVTALPKTPQESPRPSDCLARILVDVLLLIPLPRNPRISVRTLLPLPSRIPGRIRKRFGSARIHRSGRILNNAL